MGIGLENVRRLYLEGVAGGNAPYNVPRPITRNTKESGFPHMRIVERGDRLPGVLDLVVPT